MRAADEEGENRNACGDGRASTLSASASVVTVSGSVFGISNTAVTPPSTAEARARFPDLPCGFAPRLAKNAPGCR